MKRKRKSYLHLQKAQEFLTTTHKYPIWLFYNLDYMKSFLITLTQDVNWVPYYGYYATVQGSHFCEQVITLQGKGLAWAQVIYLSVTSSCFGLAICWSFLVCIWQIVSIYIYLCVCVSLPKSSVVQCRVSIFIFDLNWAVCLQQGLHHLHVALVSSNLQRSLALVLDIHLPWAHTSLQIHQSWC